jgi:riboflavin biosynthesis pyrimidine reductase
VTTRAIFVVNARGEWQDSSGSSREVSNAADLEFLISSRRWCDLIVSSGLTVRNNKYSPTQRPLWIISRHADAFDQLVSAGAQVIAASATETIAIAAAKFENILCEFGPSCLNEVIHAGLLDEFDLSVTGKFNQSNLKNLISELPVKLAFDSVNLVHEASDLAVFRFILHR